MTTEEWDFQARVVHALRRPMTEEETWEASIAPEDGDPVTEVLRLRAKLEQVTRRGIQLERQVRADHGGSIPGSIHRARLRWEYMDATRLLGSRGGWEIGGVADVRHVVDGLWHWGVAGSDATGCAPNERVGMRIAGFAALLLGLVHEEPLLPGETEASVAGTGELLAVEVPRAAT